VLVQGVRVPRNPTIISIKAGETCTIPLGVTEITLVACLKDTESTSCSWVNKPLYQQATDYPDFFSFFLFFFFRAFKIPNPINLILISDL
jgi:hypothetical protein